MKRTILYTLYIYIGALLATSCVADLEPLPKGWLQIERPVKDSVTETRTTEEIDYLVSIKKGESLVMAPIRYSQLNGNISLSEGTDYTLIAESCTKTEAESQPTIFGQPRYAGFQPFSIAANTSTEVTVNCSLANAAFKVRKDASFYYTDFSVSATVNARTLTFTDEEQMGYFNVNDNGETIISYQVTATDAEGRQGTGQGTIKLKARTLSILTLKATDLGYIGITITYDNTFTPIVTDVIVTP